MIVHELLLTLKYMSRIIRVYFYMLKARPTMTIKSVLKSNKKLLGILKTRNVIPTINRREIAFTAGASYALFATCTGGRDAIATRGERGLPVYVPHELKGFYMVRGRKRERGRPHCARSQPITSGEGYRVSRVLRRSKTGMASRSQIGENKRADWYPRPWRGVTGPGVRFAPADRWLTNRCPAYAPIVNARMILAIAPRPFPEQPVLRITWKNILNYPSPLLSKCSFFFFA